MRTELLSPDTMFLQAQAYNALMTTHGISMLFLFATPMIAAFANYFIPLLIGADDMAFPRMNAIAFWLLPPAAILIWIGFPLGAIGSGIQPAQTSWTMYTPLSAQQPSPATRLDASRTPPLGHQYHDGGDKLHRDHLHRTRPEHRVGEPRFVLVDDPHAGGSHPVRLPDARERASSCSCWTETSGRRSSPRRGVEARFCGNTCSGSSATRRCTSSSSRRWGWSASSSRALRDGSCSGSSSSCIRRSQSASSRSASGRTTCSPPASTRVSASVSWRCRWPSRCRAPSKSSTGLRRCGTGTSA